MQVAAVVDSLRCVGHGQTYEVATGQSEESHDDGENGIMVEDDGEEGATLDVTEHQQGDEDHTGDHERREQAGLFARLHRGRGEIQEKEGNKSPKSPVRSGFINNNNKVEAGK